MGCRHSKPTTFALEMEAAKEEQAKEERRDTLMPAPTPYDIRKIRNELFSRDSIMAAIPSNGTASTQEDSLGGFSAPSNDGVVFLPENEIPNKPQKKIRYHYPAALYQKMKTVHHFVPSSNQKQEFPALRHVSSGESDANSYASDDMGSVYSMVYQRQHEQLQQQLQQLSDGLPFEALVDTMALSLEPPSDDFYGMNPQLSFGALVDQLTEAEEASSEEDELEGGEFSTACPAMAFQRPKKKRAARHFSAPPAPTTPTTNSISMLEPQMSYEIAADIKSMALMAGMSERSITRGSVTNNNNSQTSRQTSQKGDIMTSCVVDNQPTKFYRNDSVVPAKNDNATVCSGW